MTREERIRQVIRAFDGQGHHRTGTPVDAASGAWLRARLEEQGGEARLETYPFERFVPSAGSLEVAGKSIPGLPLFDSGRTSSVVRGRLGSVGSSAEIGLAIVAPGGAAPVLESARSSNLHRAIVCVTVGRRSGLAPRNAPAYMEPFGPPILQVSGEYREELEGLSGQGAVGTVTAGGAMVPGTASNVVGRIPGRDPELPPIVIMTPRSGWWQCGSERGGGIACWLESARAIAAEPLQRDLVLIASTGHEIGHWGLERFLEAHPALAKRAIFWLHLGASIGAALSPQPVAFSSHPQLMALAIDALSQAGAPPVRQAPNGTVPGGESKNIHERGGRYISFAGGSEVFHLAEDRWPEAVDVAAVAAYCEACVSILRAVDQGSAPEAEDVS